MLERLCQQSEAALRRLLFDQIGGIVQERPFIFVLQAVIDLDGFLIAGPRFGVFAEALIAEAEVGVYVGIIGLERDRPFGSLDRFRYPAL